MYGESFCLCILLEWCTISPAQSIGGGWEIKANIIISNTYSKYAWNHNPRVGGSNPSSATKTFNEINKLIRLLEYEIS